MALCPEHPKRDQNPKFTPLSETTSIPVCFIWESPPPQPGTLIRLCCILPFSKDQSISLAALPHPFAYFLISSYFSFELPITRTFFISLEGSSYQLYTSFLKVYSKPNLSRKKNMMVLVKTQKVGKLRWLQTQLDRLGIVTIHWGVI